MLRCADSESVPGHEWGFTGANDNLTDSLKSSTSIIPMVYIFALKLILKDGSCRFSFLAPGLLSRCLMSTISLMDKT